MPILRFAATFTFAVFCIVALPTGHAQMSQGYDCGETLLTQWKVHFKKKRIARIATARHPDYMCEPAAPLYSNAEAIFLNEARKPLWSRKIQVGQTLSFDRKGADGKLAGGIVEVDEAVIQLKLPRNETTARAKWLLLKLKDGSSYGPARLR